MAAPKRTKVQRERDLQMLADMYLRGYSQAVIAKRLGVSQPQISLDLQKLYRQWRASALVDFNEAKQRELSRIDVVEREYWRAWRESRKERQKTRTAKTDKAGRTQTTAQMEREERNGDPRFLAGVQWCIEQRCKVLGINAPEKSFNIDLDGLTNEQLQRIANGEDPARVVATTRSGGA